MKIITALASLVLAAAAVAAPAPDGAEVYFISPADGETVHGAVTVRFGLNGMGVSPAGHEAPNSGHHHLLIDVEALPPLDQPLPKSDQMLHFGGGQTQTTLDLEPGKHTLQLVLGDHSHIPHEPPVVSERISITVEIPDG